MASYASPVKESRRGQRCPVHGLSPPAQGSSPAPVGTVRATWRMPSSSCVVDMGNSRQHLEPSGGGESRPRTSCSARMKPLSILPSRNKIGSPFCASGDVEGDVRLFVLVPPRRDGVPSAFRVGFFALDFFFRTIGVDQRSATYLQPDGNDWIVSSKPRVSESCSSLPFRRSGRGSLNVVADEGVVRSVSETKTEYASACSVGI